MPFFDPDDSPADRQSKKILLVYVLSMFSIVIGLSVFATIPHLLSEEGDTESDPHMRSIISLCIQVASTLVWLSSLAYWYKRGLTVVIKVIFTSLGALYILPFWITGYDASMFSLCVVFIDVALALSSYGDVVAMENVASLIMVVCLFGVTLDCVDFSADLGLHVYGRNCNNWSSFYKWITLACPAALNFYFLRHFIRNVRAQEQHAVQSVETAFRIAGMLANYDLDSAEKLLCHDLRSGVAESINEPLSRLCANLRTYKVFLPEYLFSATDAQTDMANFGEPNEVLCKAMGGKEASLTHLMSAVNKMQSPNYNLNDFRYDMVCAYPELDLYLQAETDNDEYRMSSGRTNNEEHERTLGALYSVYCLLRLDLDGKEVFSFGVDDYGCPLRVPSGTDASKKQHFYDDMPWHELTELLARANVIQKEDGVTYSLRKDRVIALLTLTAIHDIMKNKVFLPYVCQRHAPFRGYSSDEQIIDHDIALEYVLVNFPALLPAFRCLEPGQRAPILFSQAKMGFNNGWLVQGEAPPGALFGRFKKVIMEGRTSSCDISFYFLHWLTDLAGAEPYRGKPWPGAEKFTTKFPLKVLAAFLDSFGFVDRLAISTEVQTMEEYLESRWSRIGYPASSIPLGSEIALKRLTLMAQEFEVAAIKAFCTLPVNDRVTLSTELACTGRREHYCNIPECQRSTLSGPAILVYYAPALLQTAGAEQCVAALRVLAAVFRAARRLFPLSESCTEDTATIRIDLLKGMKPSQIWSTGPWHLLRSSGLDAEAAPGPAGDYNSAAINLSLGL